MRQTRCVKHRVFDRHVVFISPGEELEGRAEYSAIPDDVATNLIIHTELIDVLRISSGIFRLRALPPRGVAALNTYR